MKQITILTPQGRLDAAGARPLEAELAQHIAAGEVNLLIDLAGTRYISSNGLRALLVASKRAKKRGGSLRLCCLSPRVAEIFEMAGFDRVFEIFASREQAEKSFG
ncbi:MAG: STAS domain-containing protein [Chloroflexota bacterium]|nr:STAS domain-containing protein [Chloroflexota bacterium]